MLLFHQRSLVRYLHFVNEKPKVNGLFFFLWMCATYSVLFPYWR